MIAHAMTDRFGLQRLLWFGLIALAAIFAGYSLAANMYLLFLVICSLGWLATLPYHTKISLRLAIATFGSALILPFFPGRPFLWELSALLGWSGLFTTLATRKDTADFFDQIRKNRWLFIGVAGYVTVLLATMYYRGFGLRILGGTQTGGRHYVQQLICAVFPLSFLVCRFEEKTLTRLFMLQCALTATYLISDLVFARGSGKWYFLLQFFEIPVDAVNFEVRATHYGIRRYQSLALTAQGMLFLMMILFPLKDFLVRRGFWLTPLSLGILGIGLLSGHRWLAMIVVLTVLFCAIAQRLFTLRNTIMLSAVLFIWLPFTYALADRLPLAGQRAISFLPGIKISEEARLDGAATLETRRIMRKIGLEMAPQYLWMGRGFERIMDDYSYLWDQTGITSHLNQGIFFNGTIGLLVNTGLSGTLFMMLFLGAGTVLAWKVIKKLRRAGCEDVFTRMCTVLAGFWMANLIAFLFLHGDSEWALKTFSLQAGMLLACNGHLQRRLEAQPVGL